MDRRGAVLPDTGYWLLLPRRLRPTGCGACGGTTAEFECFPFLPFDAGLYVDCLLCHAVAGMQASGAKPPGRSNPAAADESLSACLAHG